MVTGCLFDRPMANNSTGRHTAGASRDINVKIHSATRTARLQANYTIIAEQRQVPHIQPLCTAKCRLSYNANRIGSLNTTYAIEASAL
jgi:hypothetical protein